jgi:thiol:disulfide interchange protein DsbC
MKLFKLLFTISMLVLAHTTHAESPQEANLRKLIAPRLGEGATIESVHKTPYSGLYELHVGSELIYTDEEAKYLFVGRILDTKTMKDFTKARLDDITRVKFSDLPIEDAIKTVKGNGQRVIAVFEDPNCGYCKRLRQTLQGVDNVTVYTFLYNILSPDSAVKSKNIWCTADRSKSWDDWMLRGKEASVAAANCTSPNDKVFALGQKLRITGTPTIFFADGTRVPGAVDAKNLEVKFAAIKAGPSAAQ